MSLLLYSWYILWKQILPTFILSLPCCGEGNFLLLFIYYLIAIMLYCFFFAFYQNICCQGFKCDFSSVCSTVSKKNLRITSRPSYWHFFQEKAGAHLQEHFGGRGWSKHKTRAYSYWHQGKQLHRSFFKKYNNRSLGTMNFLLHCTQYASLCIWKMRD